MISTIRKKVQIYILLYFLLSCWSLCEQHFSPAGDRGWNFNLGGAARLAGAGPGVEDREDKLLVKQLSNIHRHLWYTPTSIMEHNTKAGEKTKAWNIMDQKTEAVS